MTHLNTRGVAYLPAIFIVIALVAAIGVGYVLIKQPFAETTTSSLTTITENPFAKLAAIPSDWKTYTSEKYGYSLRYPADWVFKVQGEGSVGLDSPGLPTLSSTVDVREGKGLDEAGKILRNIEDGTGKKCSSDITFSFKGVQIRKAVCKAVVYDGIEANYYLAHGGNLFEMVNKGADVAQATSTVLNQIASSVTFTPPLVTTNTSTSTNTVVDPTADWKTYTNTRYNYSIKYPSDYKPSGTLENYRFDKGTPGYAGFSNLIISTVTKRDENVPENQDLYTWGKQGFPVNVVIAGTHQNPRKETLGELTFMVTDGDLASSGIPEYLVFHNNILYWLSSYSGDASQALNKQLISTFYFTK